MWFTFSYTWQERYPVNPRDGRYINTTFVRGIDAMDTLMQVLMAKLVERGREAVRASAV